MKHFKDEKGMIYTDIDIVSTKDFSQLTYDVITQGVEYNNGWNLRNYNAFRKRYVEFIEDYYYNVVDNNLFAYNCGLFGFNSEDAKNKYVEFYNELENLYSWRLLFEPYYEQIFVVLEQYALNCFATKENLTVKYLLAGTSLDEQSKIANKVGYVHLFGGAKYLEVNIKKIADILESEYLHIYNKLETLK